jgi:hypothetical protein
MHVRTTVQFYGAVLRTESGNFLLHIRGRHFLEGSRGAGGGNFFWGWKRFTGNVPVTCTKVILADDSKTGLLKLRPDLTPTRRWYVGGLHIFVGLRLGFQYKTYQHNGLLNWAESRPSSSSYFHVATSLRNKQTKQP